MLADLYAREGSTWRTARALGFSQPTIVARLKHYGIPMHSWGGPRPNHRKYEHHGKVLLMKRLAQKTKTSGNYAIGEMLENYLVSNG